MADSPWPTIEAERRALADDLATLSAEQFQQASMCDGWTVLQTLGHINATAAMTPPRFFAKMIGAGFSFPKMAAAGIAAEAAAGPDAAVARLRSLAPSRSHPPGPVDSWLGETIIHAEDIRRPLGIAHAYPIEALVRLGDFYKGSNLIIGAKKRIEGVALRATDAEWTHGSGPEVAGPMLALVLAMTGRAAGLDGLTGPGVEHLAPRCT